MGRYVSPRGVEIEMTDEAARAIGYTAKQAEPSASASRRRRKKPDEPAEASEDE